jgi:hypothetical protein
MLVGGYMIVVSFADLSSLFTSPSGGVDAGGPLSPLGTTYGASDRTCVSTAHGLPSRMVGAITSSLICPACQYHTNNTS